MLKAVILTPQHKESNPRNNPLSTSRFLQVPHHIDIYMKPIKLQAISERKKKKNQTQNPQLHGDINANNRYNTNYYLNLNTYLELQKNLSRLE